MTETQDLAHIIISHYDGAKKDDLYDGHGTAHFLAGHRYVGTWSRGKMDGVGTYIWSDGAMYKGDFKDNKIMGHGNYTWANGCEYEGQVQDGLRHGQGHFVCKLTETQYMGEWKSGRVGGKGRLDYSPRSFYEGDWLDGRKHGYGIMTYASGNVYEGEWVHNVKQGKGTMHWIDRDEEYTGQWENNLPDGYGIYIWHITATQQQQFPMQNRYDGEWLEGKRHGRGTFQYASGARYEGKWKDNMKHGHGCYISDDGRQYEGEFANDRMVGEFPKYQNDCPFVFRLNDLLPTTDPHALESQLKQINNVLLRHIGALRKLYAQYSNLGRQFLETFETTAMTKCQLWRMFRDCRLESKGIPLVDMDRAYAMQFKDDPSYPNRYQQPHSPADSLILHDFLDHILRVAHITYGSQSNLSIHESGLPAALGYLIKTDLLPNLRTDSRFEVDDIPAELKVDNRAGLRNILVQLKEDVEHRHMAAIHQMYMDRAVHRVGSLPGSSGDVTMTIRDFLLMLKEYGLIVDYNGPLTVPYVISVFAKHLPAVIDNGSYNLEFELVPYELFAALYECVIKRHMDYVENTLVPVLEGRQPITAAKALPEKLERLPESAAEGAVPAQDRPSGAEGQKAVDPSAPRAPAAAQATSVQPPHVVTTPQIAASTVQQTPAALSNKPSKHTGEKDKDKEKEKDGGGKAPTGSKAMTEAGKLAKEELSMGRARSISKTFHADLSKDRDKDTTVAASSPAQSGPAVEGPEGIKGTETKSDVEPEKIPGSQVTQAFKERVKTTFDDVLKAHEKAQKTRRYQSDLNTGISNASR